MEAEHLKKYFDDVMDGLEALGLEDICNIILTEGRMTEMMFSMQLAQQIFECEISHLDAISAAKTIYHSLVQAYAEKTANEVKH